MNPGFHSTITCDKSYYYQRIFLTIMINVFIQLSRIPEIQSTSGSGSRVLTAGFFKMFQNVSKLSIGSCRQETSVYKIGCISSCMRDVTCAGVFVEWNQDGLSWKCTLCDEPWPAEQMAIGSGHYGLSKYGGHGVEPTVISGAPNPRVETAFNRNVASYTCTHGGMKFQLFYDLENARWPGLNAACLSTICTQRSMSGTIVDVKEDSSQTFSLIPQCRSTERTDGHLQCNSFGYWTIHSSSTLILCVPTTCWKRNVENRVVYGGYSSTTDGGKTCQRWDQILPHFHVYSGHDFPGDNMSRNSAMNYCRDPGRNGYLWCYTTDLFVRWQHCPLPEC